MSFTTLFTKAQILIGMGNTSPPKGNLKSAFEPMSHDDFKAAIMPQISSFIPDRTSQRFALNTVANMEFPETLSRNSIYAILHTLAEDKYRRSDMEVPEFVLNRIHDNTGNMEKFLSKYPPDSSAYQECLSDFNQLTAPYPPSRIPKVSGALRLVKKENE